MVSLLDVLWGFGKVTLKLLEYLERDHAIDSVVEPIDPLTLGDAVEREFLH